MINDYPNVFPRLMIPELVQTSIAEHGAACVKSLLEGFGVEASYEFIRDACQPEADGTSIGTIQKVIRQFGLEAEEIMLPSDHVLLPEACALPAIVIVKSYGLRDFMVVWRYHLNFAQVMIPAFGRRWITPKHFEDLLYIHKLPVEAGEWRKWAASQESVACLRRGLENLQVSPRAATSMIDVALADQSWRSIASLHACIRMIDSMIHSGGLPSGRQSAQRLQALFEQVIDTESSRGGTVAQKYWPVLLAPPNPNAEQPLVLQGAVLVRVCGQTSNTGYRTIEQQGTPDEEAALLKGALPINGNILFHIDEQYFKNDPFIQKHYGDAYLDEGRWADAITYFGRALTLKPDYLEAENNLAMALLGENAYEDARVRFSNICLLHHGLSSKASAQFRPEDSPAARQFYASPFKLVDCIEQLSYLLSRRKIHPSFSDLVEVYKSLLDEIKDRPNRRNELTEQQIRRFGGYYDKIVYYEEVPTQSVSSLNDAIDYEAIEEQYFHKRIVCIDDFLTPETLESLQRFLLNSTIFFACGENDLVGAYMVDGLSSKVLFQIAMELKQRLPRVLRDRPLGNIWCFRHATNGGGTKPHNDEASVTLNLWLTPDVANLGSASGGGMAIYNKEQPDGWHWQQFNIQRDYPQVIAQIESYLAGAELLSIPYRCNRAVLFHSALFHKTEPFEFRNSFENRRMNLTMLFGQRGQESVACRTKQLRDAYT